MAEQKAPFWARYVSECVCSLCGKREHANVLTGTAEELVCLGWWFHPTAANAVVCKDCQRLPGRPQCRLTRS